MRDGLLRVLAADGREVVRMPISHARVRLTPGRTVRIEGPTGSFSLWGISAQTGIRAQLRQLVQAEGAGGYGIAGPLGPHARGLVGALDLGGSSEMAKGSVVLHQFLLAMGAQPG